MRPDEADAAYLWHMLQTARAIERSLAGIGFDAYLADEDRQAALERRLEVVGEAARRVSQAFRLGHPEVPWAQIVAQRNVLAHLYYDLKQDLVWESATVGIPALIRLLEPLVPPAPADPE